MFPRCPAKRPDDLLLPPAQRPVRGACFLRLPLWSDALEEAAWKCHEAARTNGVILPQGIANPESSHLLYYRERMGDGIHEDAAGLAADLEKWIPELAPERRQDLAVSIGDLLAEQARQGKPESARRSLAVKLMCWLYYGFRSVAGKLGREPFPLVFCVAESLSAHALIFLRLLSGIGADVLLLEPAGDAAYLALDPENAWSDPCAADDAKPFPAGFSLREMQRRHAPKPAPAPVPTPTPTPAPAPAARPALPQFTVGARPGVQTSPARPGVPAVPELKISTRPAPAASASKPRLHPEENEIMKRLREPAHRLCVNAWMQEPGVRNLLTPANRRSEDDGLFCTALIRVSGVRDKLTYPQELYNLYRDLTAAGRTVRIEDGGPEEPAPEAISRIHRRPAYRSATELIVDLAMNLPQSGEQELTRFSQRAFAETMMEEDLRISDLRQLRNEAVELLAWIQSAQPRLFGSWRGQEIPVYILMGHCRGTRECLALRWLSKMPADVLILAPDLGKPCAFRAPELLDLKRDESLAEFAFPRDPSGIAMRTVASHASDEIGAVLGESGFYHSHQFGRANALVLQTTRDEIFQYWDLDLSYRPSFSAENGTVGMPVLWARINGVDAKDELAYWQQVSSLLGKPDIVLLRSFPSVKPLDARQRTALAQRCLRNGRILEDALMSDRDYPYSRLRREIQRHILEKAQLMLDQRLIQGTFVNGTEYTVVSTVLSLPPQMQQLLQSFDFTRRNPKVVCVHNGDSQATLEDAILLTFLSLAGFDIVLFAPTGYQAVENFLAGRLPVVHEAGPYHFDYKVPDFSTLPKKGGLLGALKRKLRGD